MCMYTFKCACCSRTCAFIHVCMRIRGTARERKNSSHLHSVYSVAAVETNCQTERRGGGDLGGAGGNRMTGCEVITSAYGCRKPYIRGVYAYEITAKGVNRPEEALWAASFRCTLQLCISGWKEVTFIIQDDQTLLIRMFDSGTFG